VARESLGEEYPDPSPRGVRRHLERARSPTRDRSLSTTSFARRGHIEYDRLFRVHERDGPARVGELRLSSPGDDARTRRRRPRRTRVRSGAPTGTFPRVTSRNSPCSPSGVPRRHRRGSPGILRRRRPRRRVSQRRCRLERGVESQGTDAYALSNVQSVMGHGAALAEAVGRTGGDPRRHRPVVFRRRGRRGNRPCWPTPASISSTRPRPS